MMTAENLNEIVKSLREYKRMKEELEAEIDALTDQIKAEMTAQNADTLTGPDWKATWKNVTSARFDSKTFKAEHADLYVRYSKSSETRRFVLA